MKIHTREKTIEERIQEITVRDLIEKKLKLNPEEVLVIDRQNNRILPPDYRLKDEDEIEIRMVISGG